jgi:hypothetical protein
VFVHTAMCNFTLRQKYTNIPQIFFNDSVTVTILLYSVEIKTLQQYGIWDSTITAHAFLTSTLREYKPSASYPRRFDPGK